MSVVRIVTERLFLLLFWVVRLAFLPQGLALCAAMLATSMAGAQDGPAWLEVAARSSLRIGGTLFAAGVLLAIARRVALSPAVDAAESGSLSAWLLGLSVVALSALANDAAADLFALWGDVLKLLDGIGFWTGLARGVPQAGWVVLPILGALLVPALEAATAVFLVVVPPAMLVLLALRSRLFPRLFLMLGICQAGLVIAGLFGAEAFSRLAAEAIAVMRTADDVEVRRAADEIIRAQGVLVPTAAAFVPPLIGYLAWLAYLLSSARARAFFTAGAAR